MHDELVNALRLCVKYGKAQDALENAEQAADAIEELQQQVEHCHGCMNDWFEAAQEYKAQIPRWIPVSERLPEEAGKYLVCGRWRGKQTEIWVCEFMTLGYLKGWANNAANPVVSHWMPLPEPPEEES